MNQAMKNRLKRTALLCCVAMLIGGVIGMLQLRHETVRVVDKPSRVITPVAGVQVGGPFSLVNHKGQDVTQDDFAGQAKLIYFGFTYCPAICPTELQKISRVLEKLSVEDAASIQPLFITVDPQRDTVETMKEYISLFHSRFVGLTGSQAQIDHVMKQYRVFAKRVEDPTLSDYTMDHSSYIYLMSADDVLMSMYRIEDDAAYMVNDIRAKL